MEGKFREQAALQRKKHLNDDEFRLEGQKGRTKREYRDGRTSRPYIFTLRILGQSGERIAAKFQDTPWPRARNQPPSHSERKPLFRQANPPGDRPAASRRSGIERVSEQRL